MAKLYSLPLELQALRGLCDARKLKRHGYLMARLNEDCFHSEESSEIFAAIRSYVEHKGQPPSFHLMCETPNLSRETRAVLKDAAVSPETRGECDAVIEQLHVLRKTRVAYRMAKSVLESLEGKKLDLEQLQTIIADGQASMQVNRALDECFFHVGRDSNTLDLVDSILNGAADDQWIPTTWNTFDKVNGGMPRGGLVTIGGNSGAGKCVGPDTLVSLDSFVFDLDSGEVTLPGGHLVSVILHGSSEVTQVPAREFSLEYHALVSLNLA